MQLCKYRSSLIKSSVTIKSKYKRFGILDCMYICMYRQENAKTMTLYLMLALCLHQILAQNFVNQYDGVLDFRCPQGKKTRLTKNCASWSVLFFLRQTLLRLFPFQESISPKCTVCTTVIMKTEDLLLNADQVICAKS